MNILMLSAGRRVERVRLFQQALRDLGIEGRVVAADSSSRAAALAFADGARVIPACTDSGYREAVGRLCREERIDLVLSGHDAELSVLARLRGGLGVKVWVSSSECVELCRDKRRTNAWLRESGFPAVAQTSLESASPPVFVKPVNGSASIGVRRVETDRELAAFSGLEWIAEEIAPGREFTIHTYVDLAGRCRIAVPCERLEVRAGEVSKGLTVKHAGLMELAREISEALPGARGPLNIQCFLAADGAIRVIEINPRFGGGYPLADRAGAKFCRWMIEEMMGRAIEVEFDGWREDLMLLRFDEAVFVEASAGSSTNRDLPVAAQ